MSEETNNEGGLSGLKKTLIGTLGTVVTAGGVWLTTHLGGGEATDKEEVKTEQVAPAPAAAPVVINLQNNNTNQQKQQSNNSNSNKSAAPAPVQQAAPAPAPAQKESW
jgi:flagellar basal body-associated protein FliL